MALANGIPQHGRDYDFPLDCSFALGDKTAFWGCFAAFLGFFSFFFFDSRDSSLVIFMHVVM